MKPEQLVGLIREAVNQGLYSNLWKVFLVILCAAAIGAFIGAYLKKRGELTAAKEQFDETLKQIKEQTNVIEKIKREMGKSIEEMKAELTKDVEKFKLSLQDQLKRRADILIFRYTKIYAGLEEIDGLAVSNLMQVLDALERKAENHYLSEVGEFGERFIKISRIYRRVEPLLDSNLALSAKALIDKESNHSREYVFGDNFSDFECIKLQKELLCLRSKVELEIIDVLRKQLREITENT